MTEMAIVFDCEKVLALQQPQDPDGVFVSAENSDILYFHTHDSVNDLKL